MGRLINRTVRRSARVQVCERNLVRTDSLILSCCGGFCFGYEMVRRTILVFFGFWRAKLNYLPLHAGSCETLQWLFFSCFWSFDVVCTRCVITSRFKQIVIFHECIVTKSSFKKNGGKNKMPQAPASLWACLTERSWRRVSTREAGRRSC